MFTKIYSASLCLYIFCGSNAARAEDLLFDCTYRDGSHVKWTVGNNRIKSDDKEVKSKNIVITNKHVSWALNYDHVLMHAEIEIDRLTGATTWTSSFGAEKTRTTSGTSGTCNKI
jgi:hypothetical protein